MQERRRNDGGKTQDDPRILIEPAGTILSIVSYWYLRTVDMRRLISRWREWLRNNGELHQNNDCCGAEGGLLSRCGAEGGLLSMVIHTKSTTAAYLPLAGVAPQEW